MRSRDEVRFRMPVPSTGKNSRKFAVRNGKSAFIKSDAARASAKQALSAAMEACPTPWPLFGDDDVAVEIVHHVAANEIEVVMRRVGPPPADEGERVRDLQNLADVLLDAVQGVVYENDNAVVELSMRRVGAMGAGAS